MRVAVNHDPTHGGLAQQSLPISGIERSHVCTGGLVGYNSTCGGRITAPPISDKYSRFSSGGELVAAIQRCVEAHKKVFDADLERIYIHIREDHDILSPMLQIVGPSENCKFSRTGTWQFISVHALLGYSNAETVSDDLESFFHLLLYFAIRFLPHNASDVTDELLFSYFDDCTHALHGQTPGGTKFAAMHHGEIDITRFTGSKVDEDGKLIDPFLRFLWPDTHPTSESAQVRSHPINRIFCELLLWFKALYTPARNLEEVPVQDYPTDEADTISGAAALALLGIRGIDMTCHTPVSLIDQRQRANWKSEEQARLELSQKLTTHDAMAKLLAQCVSSLEWPDEDKSNSEIPGRGITQTELEDGVSVATSASSGSKRMVEVEDGAEEPGSKRFRSIRDVSFVPH